MLNMLLFVYVVGFFYSVSGVLFDKSPNATPLLVALKNGALWPVTVAKMLVNKLLK